jgi:hypothetical protein
MVFTPSISEVIFLIQTVITVYEKCKDAPSRLNEAVKDAKGIKAELKSIKSKVGDEDYYIRKNGKEM